MPQTPLEDYLDATPVDKDTKAQAWEIFNHSANQQDFESRLDQINLPKSAKADLWEAKWGSKQWRMPSQATPAPAQNAPSPTPQAQAKTPPSNSGAVVGALKNAWEWANTPANIGRLRQTTKNEEAKANPTLADVQDAEAHPIRHALVDDTKTFLSQFGAGGAKMFLTPAGIAMAAAEPFLGAPATLGKAARTIQTTGAALYGANAIKDVATKPLPQENESGADYTARMLGNAGALMGVTAQRLRARQMAKEQAAKTQGTNSEPVENTPRQPTPAEQAAKTQGTNSEPVENTPRQPTPAEQAVARQNQAVAYSEEPKSTTVYVDPAFAEHLDKWGNNSDLSQKRIILKTNKKGTTMRLAHNDPEVSGFSYTNPPDGISHTLLDKNTPGAVPVELFKTKGPRGTSVANHFLDYKTNPAVPVQTEPVAPAVDKATEPSIAAPQTPLPAPPTVPTPSTPTEAAPTAPAASETPLQRSKRLQEALVAKAKVAPRSVPEEGLSPGQNPVTLAAQRITGTSPVLSAKETPGLPKDIAGSKPRYGYGNKLFQLQFEDPHDLAAYTMAQEKANKAEGQFRNYLEKEYPQHDLTDFVNHGQKVRETIKGMAKISQPEDGPLTIKSQGGIQKQVAKPSVPVVEGQETKATPLEETLKPAQAASPSKPIGPLEDRIRKTAGQIIQGTRLLKGETLSEPIDRAIRISRTSEGLLPDDLAAKMEQHLNEPVGNRLTEEQIAKLESLRGGTLAKEPTFTVLDKNEFERQLAGPEGEEKAARLARWQDKMLEDLVNPSVSDDVKAKINEALQPDENGQMKYVQYERKMEYPRPEELPPDHPEAPFVEQKLGHEITPLTRQNLRAAGFKPYNKLFQTSRGVSKYVTPAELASLEELEKRESPESFGSPELPSEEGDYGNPQQAQLREILGSSVIDEQKGRVFKPRVGNADYAAAYRDLATKAFSRKLSEVMQSLKSQVGEWNQARGQAQTPLTEQLSKLSAEARQYLPPELFDFEKPAATNASEKSATSPNEQSVQASSSTPKTSATVRPGAQSPTEGLKYTKWDSILKKENPKEFAQTDVIREAVASNTKIPAASKQQMYARASQAFHDAVKSNDPFALKQAIDTVVRPKEAGFVSASGDLYSPEQTQFINAAAADAFLSRWERMSDPELFKKKDGLWADSMVDRIEGAKPNSTDPEIREAQTEYYNELKARHDALKEKVGMSSKLWDNVTDFLDKIAEKNLVKTVMRQVRGHQYRSEAVRRQYLLKYDQLFGELPLPEQDRAFQAMMTGDSLHPDLFQAIDPATLDKWSKKNGSIPDPNEVARLIKDTMAGARERYSQASGNLTEFLTNYMRGIYENQAQSRQFSSDWTSRRPLAGNADFLKEKIYEYHSDALRAGLQPVTSNPVRSAMMVTDMLDRATMAHTFKNRLVKEGVVDWYAHNETPPQGHIPLNDSIFGNQGPGSYYGPSHVVKAFNNFVSTGLTGKWRVPFTNFSLYDALKNMNSTANQLELSLSLFHGMETMANSITTAGAVGLKQIFNEGKLFTGLKNVITSPIAPFQDTWHGQRGLVAFNDPVKALDYGESAERYLQAATDAERVNANVRNNLEFKIPQVDRFKEAWATATDDFQTTSTRAVAVAKAAKSVLNMGVETMAYPLMQSFIPRVKMGAFMRMAEQIHSEYAGAAPEVIQAELEKAWDSIDNRFGQVNYDNMFLNRTTKDIMHLVVRSPGWNIGTLREGIGGGFDLGKSLYSASKGNGFKISNRTAYSAALIANTMLFNSLYQYIHTGQVAHGIDYFFPKDGTKSAEGEDNRMFPKLYTYDYINLYHDPVHTIWHKASPVFSTIADVIMNANYYHHEIRDPGNSFMENTMSTLAYLAHQFTPFSVNNWNESQLRGDKDYGDSMVGIMPAPRWVGRTNAENLAFKYFEGTQSQGPQDEVTWEKQRSFLELRSKVAKGQITPEQIQQAVNQGKISPKMVQYLYDTKINPETGKPLEPQIVTWTKRLGSEQQVWNVWKAASPEEKKILLPTIVSKMSNLTSGPRQQEVLEELQRFSLTH